MSKIVVRLKGGLGNQMFQYAAGRALALRNDASLILDTHTGFVRDRIYRRAFSLGAYPLAARAASVTDRLPFWDARWHGVVARAGENLFSSRPWGVYIQETEPRFLPAVQAINLTTDAYLDGYWQSEQYFHEERLAMRRELRVPEAVDTRFLAMAEVIRACDSVAVGVRLFEEVPGVDKNGVGGLVPMSYYEEAAARLAESLKNPVFFAFSIRDEGVKGKLKLPGPIHYVTHNNGYSGELQRLWLISQCTHHIVSNSSFYWWGAWLAEQEDRGSIVMAYDRFPNRDTIPRRWHRFEPPPTKL
jgi:hypothetical protein